MLFCLWGSLKPCVQSDTGLDMWRAAFRPLPIGVKNPQGTSGWSCCVLQSSRGCGLVSLCVPSWKAARLTGFKPWTKGVSVGSQHFAKVSPIHLEVTDGEPALEHFLSCCPGHQEAFGPNDLSPCLVGTLSRALVPCTWASSSGLQCGGHCCLAALQAPRSWNFVKVELHLSMLLKMETKLFLWCTTRCSVGLVIGEKNRWP